MTDIRASWSWGVGCVAATTSPLTGEASIKKKKATPASNPLYANQHLQDASAGGEQMCEGAEYI